MRRWPAPGVYGPEPVTADEALAKALWESQDTPSVPLWRDVTGKARDYWLGLAAAVRSHGWVPLTEVEEALRRDWALVCRDHHTYPDCLPHVSAADFVASLGRKP